MLENIPYFVGIVAGSLGACIVGRIIQGKETPRYTKTLATLLVGGVTFPTYKEGAKDNVSQ